MISPITVGLVVGTAALVRIVGGPWLLAVLLGVVVWVLRVTVAVLVARRVRGLERRIDPFALREPWRFFVRDALTARNRFAGAVDEAADGPLRDRLRDIEARMDQALAVTWDVAQHGQRLTDTRRRIDLAAIERTIAATPPDDARHRAALAQQASHARIAARENETKARLEILEARLDETIVRAAELATRTGDTVAIEALAEQVESTVDELDSLRIALDEVSEES